MKKNSFSMIDDKGNEMYYRTANGKITYKMTKNERGITIDTYDNGQLTGSYEYIFYYMYGHMNDWVRYAEKEVICAKAMLVQAIHIEETIKVIRNSRTFDDAIEELMDLLGLDEIGARYVAERRLSQLTGIRPDMQKEDIGNSRE